MTDDRKTELRALLKPGLPEPTAEQFELLDVFWTEYRRRRDALTVGLVTPLVVATDAMDPALARQWISDAAAALGAAPDAATVQIVEVR